MFHFNYRIDIIKMYGIRNANISDFFVIATYIRVNLLKNSRFVGLKRLKQLVIYNFTRNGYDVKISEIGFFDIRIYILTD